MSRWFLAAVGISGLMLCQPAAAQNSKTSVTTQTYRTVHGIQLRPGERLVSINGVPVSQLPQTQSHTTTWSHIGSIVPAVPQTTASPDKSKPSAKKTTPEKSAVDKARQAISGAASPQKHTSAKPPIPNSSTAKAAGSEAKKPTVVPAVPGVKSGLIVNRDPEAYAHALREAKIIASRGEGYHRFGDGGHPLGVAPGCRYAGTGYSRDPNRPNHCYEGELPESRLVARAMVPGPNGTYFWSAHYR